MNENKQPMVSILDGVKTGIADVLYQMSGMSEEQKMKAIRGSNYVINQLVESEFIETLTDIHNGISMSCDTGSYDEFDKGAMIALNHVLILINTMVNNTNELIRQQEKSK